MKLSKNSKKNGLRQAARGQSTPSYFMLLIFAKMASAPTSLA
jgi:hypothetical protein